MAVKYLLACALLLVSLSGCSPKKNHTQQDTIVVALGGDIDTFNPLFTTDATGQEIVELLYPALILPEADTTLGTLRFSPSFARAFEFSNDNKDILFH